MKRLYLGTTLPDRKSYYRHLLIAEQALGRPLPKGVEVHHVNEDKYDNRNANLVICQDRKYHGLLHVRQRVIRAGGNPNTQRICNHCKQLVPLDECLPPPKNGGSVCRRCRNAIHLAAQKRRRASHQGT